MKFEINPEGLNIDDLIPAFETKGMNLGLERIKTALKKLGNPCKEIPAIQIAGTNGKGSIASFIESCLIKAGVKTGCTTSPHLFDWCERIKINGKMISKKEFRENVNFVKKECGSNLLTPFELIVASAFRHFSLNEIQLIILEIGLGGRLDATTAHPLRPIIALASIGLDHCEYLGNDIQKITKEKLAVITPGSIVISSKQDPEVERILKETVKSKKANLHLVPPLSRKWELGLAGKMQRKNAAVAKAVLEALPSLGIEIKNNHIREGLAATKWPGRMQYTKWERLPLLLDGAHNPHAIQQLAQERSNWPKRNDSINWIIGIQANKDAKSMLKQLLREGDIAWIVPVPNHKSWTVENLSNACPEISNQLRMGESVFHILEILRLKQKWPEPAPVITGSLYLIAEVLKRLQKKEKSFPTF